MAALWSRYLIIAVAALAVADIFVPAKALAEAKIGVSAAVRGSVFVRSGDATGQRRAKVDESILLQDEVLTKQQSALQILLLDQSVFTVGENCEMIIDRFVYDPDRNAGEMSGTVLKGAFRFMSGRIGKANPTKANINTPAATIGIRGTMFEGVVGTDAIKLAALLGLTTAGADQDKAVLVILRGPGRNTNSLSKSGIINVGNSAGQKTISSPNYAVFVPGPGQPPIGPVKVTQEVLDYFDFYLRSLPNGPTFGNDESSGEGESGQDVFNIPDGDFPPLNDLFIDELFDNQFEEFDDHEEPDCECSECCYYDTL
ncbi:FecR family protein [Hoeflea poritis]|uniref:FecR domain-containing protein n=1 Tax=Hoeflea poritis TaxID=2993659 RepID=A0ABT4VTF5_9HYPH|nr:FecR domain-containing protein [Hoeflea poritis]MDA4847993.1 FecR domain-containing protein [Hoeflea poritis]